MLLVMNPSIPNADASATCPLQTKNRRRGFKIMVGMVVKAKVGELEEEIREGFSRRSRKEITGVVQEIVGNRGF